MNLIYLVFGNDFRNHLQANFSIESFLVKKTCVEQIFVFTDLPEYFQSHDSSKVQTIKVDEAQLAEWQKPHGFFWRVKIKAIQTLIEKYPDTNWLYLDSDTFLYGDLDVINKQLNDGLSVMHLNEGLLSKLNSKTEKLMWLQSSNKTFNQITINSDHCMWNAGVIGIPKQNNKALIAEILQFCDEMCAAPITRRLIEQFSFSVILDEKTKLHDCKQIIGHYWGNKMQWNGMIRDFYSKSLLRNFDSIERKKAFEKIDLKHLPVFVRIPNTQRKLVNWIHKVFPDREHKGLD